MKVLYATAVGLVLLASPCFAAIQLDPGEWQTTETGTENGKPVPPKVEKECITPEEARDAASLVDELKKEIMDQGTQCQKADVKLSGDTVTYALKCGEQRQFVFDISGTYTILSATRYSGRMKSEITLAGQKISADKSVEAVRVGACKPGAGRKK